MVTLEALNPERRPGGLSVPDHRRPGTRSFLIYRTLNRTNATQTICQSSGRGWVRVAHCGADRSLLQISSDPEADLRTPLLIIDGKEVSWDQFGRMLTTFEGFQFRMEIIDPLMKMR